MLLQLNRWLIERFRNQELCAIVVDEAQNLSWELLEEIRLLTNLETHRRSSCRLFFPASLSSKRNFATLRSPASSAHLDVVQNVSPVQRGDAGLHAERLRIAGARQPVLSPEAVQLVYRYSKGIPRLINLICEHAMISAYVEQIKPIPARIVESVSTELDLDDQPS